MLSQNWFAWQKHRQLLLGTYRSLSVLGGVALVRVK
jgi:hypothetical protein